MYKFWYIGNEFGWQVDMWLLKVVTVFSLACDRLDKVLQMGLLVLQELNVILPLVSVRSLGLGVGSLLGAKLGREFDYLGFECHLVVFQFLFFKKMKMFEDNNF